jgi:hypothetical protein
MDNPNLKFSLKGSVLRPNIFRLSVVRAMSSFLHPTTSAEGKKGGNEEIFVERHKI